MTTFLKPFNELPLVGEDIVVVGNPLGLESTVSKGIISAVRKTPKYGNILQISAPISPGSSGSPVLNMKGQVIGVATLTIKEGQALNFAIPSETILNLETVDNLIRLSQLSLTSPPASEQDALLPVIKAVNCQGLYTTTLINNIFSPVNPTRNSHHTISYLVNREAYPALGKQ